jgi:ubiquinol-cytochrome c reductase cytochrome b subunit
MGMFGSILIWFFLPWLDRSPVRSGHFRPTFRKFYYLLIADVVVLGYCGGSPAEEIYYFLHFLVILPIVSSIETPDALPFSITEAVLGVDEAAALAAQ